MTLRRLLVAILCLAWILPGLIAHDPWKSDEAVTFGVVYELLRGGSWIVSHLAGEVFIDEPPLYYLVSAATAWLFSPLLPLHDGARLASGLFMVITFVFCGLAGRELNGPNRGTLAVMLLLGCFGLVVRSHQSITDIAPLAGYAIGYYALALALRRPVIGGTWLGAGLGMVFLSQGVFETIVLALIAALLPIVSAEWRTRRYAMTFAVALAVALPLLVVWPLLLHQQSPELMWAWLQADLAVQLGGEQREWFYYLRIMPWYAWPLWALCAWTLWATRRSQFTTPAIALPLTGLAVTTAALSLGSSARDLYALPLLPAFALLAVPGIQNLRRGAANAWYWFSLMGATFFVVVFWFYWMGLELGVPARLHAHLHRLQPGYAPGFKWLPFTIAAIYTAAWFVLLARLKRSAERPVIAWAAGVALLWGVLNILFIGWVDTAKSYRPVFTSLQQKLPAQYRCIASRDLGESQRAMLHYVAQIVTQRQELRNRRRDCDLLLTQGAVEERVPAGWHKIWEGARPGDKVERYRLYHRAAAASPG